MEKKKRGFTLIELLAVIVILSVIAIIAVSVIGDVIEQAKIKKYFSEEKAMESAAELYLVKNQNSLEDGVKTQTIDLRTLVDAKTIKAVHDSGNGGLCNGKVLVEVGENEKSVSFKGCLKCSNYETKGEECGYELAETEIVDKNKCQLEVGTGANASYYYINSEEDLYAFSNSVNAGEDYTGKVVSLNKNLDMSKTIEEVQESCGDTVTTFNPIGNSTNQFKGTFEGNAYTISNLTINQSSTNYVGLFGYNAGTIRGLNIEGISITGNQYVGGIAGYNTGTIRDIALLSASITGTDRYIGGITGYGGTVTNVLANVNVTGSSYAGGISGYGSTLSNIVLKDGLISGNNSGMIGYASKNSVISSIYTSDSVSLSNCTGNCGNYNGGTVLIFNGVIFNQDRKNDINMYESALTTWIGGYVDEANIAEANNYYFDYDDYTSSNRKIILKSRSRNPINVTLQGDGTPSSPYEIGSVDEWKQASALVHLVGKYYKLTSDIDFSGKQYYMLGSSKNQFKGTLEGEGYVLKNIDVKGYNYVGLSGYNVGTIKGLNVQDITVSGHDYYIGGIAGYNTGTISDIALSGTVVGVSNNISSYVGGITGSGGTLISIIANVDVTGHQYAGGICGRGDRTTNLNKIILEGGTIGADSYSARIGYFDSGTLTPAIYARSNISQPCWNHCRWYPTYSQYGFAGEDFDSSYYNDLQYYGTNLKLDTTLTGDTDSSGYVFGYNSNESDIIVIKNGSTNAVSSDQIISTSSTCTNRVLPTCRLLTFKPRAEQDGMEAEFECEDDEVVTDEEDRIKVSSYFHSTRTTAATSFDRIGTIKVISDERKTEKGGSVYSIWTALTDPEHIPHPNTCYYFHYGAEDKCGNFKSYVTSYCLSY